MRMTVTSGLTIEKTVKLYDTAWKAPLSPSLVVAGPTYIAVSTIAIYTVNKGSEPKHERGKRGSEAVKKLDRFFHPLSFYFPP
jgi:hypothetical protein